MLALIPSWLKLGAIGLVCASLGLWGAYTLGKSEGRQQAAVDALERSAEVLRERKDVDEDVSASDAAALCSDFGLSDADERECMRRLGPAHAQP